LVPRTSPANVRDEAMVAKMLVALPAVAGARGRPRAKPDALLGDRGYGFARTIRQVKAKGIESRLAPRGSPHGSGLGRKRYVIEQSLAAFGQNRRLKLCYEKRPEHWQAFHELAAALICFKRLERTKKRL
jgi:hypothetical protein